MPDTGGTLKKTTHKTLGHAPASIADYNTAFSPNMAAGGWHRGDGAFSTHGSGWSLFSFNDFFVTAANGIDHNPLFRRNAVLLVDTATGVVSWLSSGDQFPLAGSVTFPGPGDSTWCWLKGGWPTGASSAILLAGRFDSGGEIDIRVMGIDAFTTASPTCTAVVTTDLSATISWRGQPFVDQGYVYTYGYRNSTFTHHVARHAYSATPADYATGWAYWTGSTWSTSVAAAVALTVSSAGLSPLNVRPWIWGYLGTAKFFDTAPELAIPDVWPDIHAWWSPTPQGPWWWIGHVCTPTIVDTWFSYLGRLEYLAGVTAPVALWSLNKSGKTTAEVSTYGPNLSSAVAPAHGHGSVSATAAPLGTSAGRGAAVGSVTVTTSAVGTGTATAGRAGTATSGQAGVGSAQTGQG